MDRIERTELFGRHVICATACRAQRPWLPRRWEVRVTALEAAIRSARRELMAAESKAGTASPANPAK